MIEPSTDDLPFLIVHGALVWKVVLAAVVVLALAIVALVRRRLARNAARATVDGLARRGADVVRGRVVGPAGGAAIATLSAACRGADGKPGAGVTATWLAGGVAIETGEGRVELAGDVHVLAGDRVRAARGGVPPATTDAMLAGFRARAPWLHRWKPFGGRVVTARLDTLAAGAEVVAEGVIERAPADGETGYRTAGAVATLRPVDGAPAIAIGARAPAAAAIPLPLGFVLLVAGLFGAILIYPVLTNLGESWRNACSAAKPTGDGFVELTNSHPCALAAATPHNRDNVLFHLRWMLDEHPYRDRRTVSRQLAVDLEVEGCDVAIGRLRAIDHQASIVALARRCGDRRSEHLALVAQGRLDEAVALPVPATADLEALPTGATLIAAGRWTEAAAVADARADLIRAGRWEAGAEDSAVATADHYHCVAELLRHHAGDAGAIDRMRAQSAEPHAPCAVALAAIAPPAERDRLLGTSTPPLFAVTRIRRTLAYSAGVVDDAGDAASVDGPESMLARPDHYRATLDVALAWFLSPDAAAVPAGQPIRRAMFLRWHAALQLMRGDHAGAAATAREVLAALAGTPTEKIYDFLDGPTFLAGLVDLYGPRLDLGLDFTANMPSYVQGVEERAQIVNLRAHTYSAILLRQGGSLEAGYFGPDPALVEGLTVAVAGDGTKLARAMSKPFSWWNPTDVMAVLPRIETGRDAIVHQMVWAPPRQVGGHGEDAWHLPLRAFAMREALAMAGVPEEAARWGEIFARWDAALSDRARLVALMLYLL